MEASLHIIVADLILVASAIYMAISYLVIVKYIRANKVHVNSLKAINFYYVYKNYIQERKRNNLAVGALFFMHIISIFVVLILVVRSVNNV